MRGLQIADGTKLEPGIALPPGDVGGLDFDLADVLAAVGDNASRSDWRIEDVECFGDSYADFVTACDTGVPIAGARLLELAKRITQVIDGRFTGLHYLTGAPWIVINAIDSAWWEVWTDDESVLASVRRRFRAVRDITESAA